MRNVLSFRIGAILCALVVLLAENLSLSASGAEAQAPVGRTSAAGRPALTPDTDLSSTLAVIKAGQAGIISTGGRLSANGQVIGGSTLAVKIGQLITAAESIALLQALSGGQRLLLTGAGAAVGGSVMATPAAVAGSGVSLAASLSSFVVPSGVTFTAVGFGTRNPLNITGDSAVFGSVYLLQTAPGLTSVMNTGGSLRVGPAALLSGVLPVGLSGGGLYSSEHLRVNVVDSLSNSGTISAPGNLRLAAGGVISNLSTTGAAPAVISACNVDIISGCGNIINSGLINALDSASFSSGTSAKNLSIMNAGGAITAVNAINLRSAGYGGSGNITLTGGDWLSQQLNLNGGTGNVEVSVDNISGTVNMVAGCARLYTSLAPTLKLGNIAISGDPTYWNAGGDVTVAGDISFATADVAIIASRDIYTSAAGTWTIDADSNGGGTGSVTLIAGANISNSGSGSGDTTTTVSYNGASATGGNIILDNNVSDSFGNTSTGNVGLISTSASGASAGNVTLIAFGTPAGGGAIVAGSTSINACSDDTNLNGNVTIIGGDRGIEGQGVRVGSINAYGGSGVNSGKVVIANATVVDSGGSITNGTLTGTFNQGTLQPCGLSSGNIHAGDSILSSSGGGTVSTQNLLSDNGIIQLQNVGPVSAGTLTTAGKSISVSSSASSVSLSAISSNNNGASNVGGTVLVQAGTALTVAGGVNSAALSAGDAGAVTLSAGAGLEVDGSVCATSVNGQAGQIQLSTNSPMPLAINAPSTGAGNIAGSIDNRTSGGSAAAISVVQNGTGGISLQGASAAVASSQQITLTAGAGGVQVPTAGEGGLSAPLVSVTASGGSIASAAAPLLTQTATLSAAADGEVFLSNSGVLAGVSSSSSSAFSLTNNGNINIGTAGINSSGAVTLATVANNGAITLYGGSIDAAGVVSLATNGSGIVAVGGGKHLITTGDISIVSGGVTFYGTVSAPGRTLTMAPNDPSASIGVNGAAGSFQIPASSFGAITTGTITIGSTSHTGPIVFNPVGNLLTMKTNMVVLGSAASTSNTFSNNHIIDMGGHNLSVSVGGSLQTGDITNTNQVGLTGGSISIGLLEAGGTITLSAINSGSVTVGAYKYLRATRNNDIVVSGGSFVVNGTVYGCGGNIAISTDSVAFNGVLDDVGGRITLIPRSSSSGIGVNGGAGAFQISGTKFDQIRAASITIGSTAGTGAIDVNTTAGPSLTSWNFDLIFLSSPTNTAASFTNHGNIGMLQGHNLSVIVGGAISSHGIGGSGGTVTLSGPSIVLESGLSVDGNSAAILHASGPAGSGAISCTGYVSASHLSLTSDNDFIAGSSGSNPMSFQNVSTLLASAAGAVNLYCGGGGAVPLVSLESPRSSSFRCTYNTQMSVGNGGIVSAGAVYLGSAGNIDISKGSITAGGDITLSAGTLSSVVVGEGQTVVAAGSSNISISSRFMVFDGVVSAGAGSGNVTLKPGGNDMSIGLNGGSGSCQISGIRLGQILADTVTIGSAAGTAAISVNGSGKNLSANYNLVFLGSNASAVATFVNSGTISMSGHNLAVTVGGSITCGAITGNSNSVSLTGGVITVNKAITLSGAASANLQASGAISGAGTISSAVLSMHSTAGLIGGDSSGGRLHTAASDLTFNAAGNVSIFNNQSLTTGTCTGNNIFLGSSGSLSFNGNMTAAAAIVFEVSACNTSAGSTVSATSITVNGLTGSALTLGNAGTMIARTGNILVCSAPGESLFVGSPGQTGALQAVNGIISLCARNSGVAANSVDFSGNQTLSGSTLLNATGFNQCVIVEENVVINGLNAVTVNSSQLNLNGSGASQGVLTGNPLVLSVPDGAGTIANSSGSIDLSGFGNLTFAGKTLAILSAGDIVNTGGPMAINLSAADGGGSLELVAGYQFTPQTSGTVGPGATAYVLSGTTSRGNIALPNVNIITSSTNAFTSAGNVLAVASGSISLGTVTSSSNLVSGTGGTLVAIGNGISVGAVYTRAFYSGSVSLNSGTPSNGAGVTITNGVMRGSFTPTTLSGNISVQTINAGNGNVLLSTGGSGKITQAPSGIISTTALLSVSSGAAGFSLCTAASNLQFNTYSTAPAASVTITSSIFSTIYSSSTGGNLSVTGASGLAVAEAQSICAAGNLTLSSSSANTGLTVGSLSRLTAFKTLSLLASGTASAIQFGDQVTIQAGRLNQSFNLPASPLGLSGSANAATSNIASAGAISITAGGLHGVIGGAGDSFVTAGGNLTLSAAGGPIAFGDSTRMEVNGGSLSLSAGGGALTIGTAAAIPASASSLVARTLNNAGGNITMNSQEELSLAPYTSTFAGGALSAVMTSSDVGAISFGSSSITQAHKTVTLTGQGSMAMLELGNGSSVGSGVANGLAGSGAIKVTVTGSVRIGSASLQAIGSGLTIATPQDILIDGGSSVVAGGNLTINAGSGVELGSIGGSTGVQVLAVKPGVATANITVNCTLILTIGDHSSVIADGGIVMSEGGGNTNFNIGEAVIKADKNVSLSNFVVYGGSAMQINANARISAGVMAAGYVAGSPVTSGQVVSAGSVTLACSGKLTTGENVDIESNGAALKLNIAGALEIGDNSQIRANGGSLTVTGSDSVTFGRTVGAGVQISTSTLNNAGGNLTLCANNGLLILGTSQVRADGLLKMTDNSSASMLSTENIIIFSRGSAVFISKGTGGLRLGPCSELTVLKGSLTLSATSTAVQPEGICLNGDGSIVVKGDISVNSTGGLSVAPSAGTMVIESQTGAVRMSGISVGIQDNCHLIAAGSVSVTNNGGDTTLQLGNGVEMTAGQLNASGSAKAYPTPILPSDIKKAGSISITTSGSSSFSGLMVGDGVKLTANGGNIVLQDTNAASTVSLGGNYDFTAHGGNISISSANTGASALVISSATGSIADSTMVAQSLGASKGTITVSAVGEVKLGAGTLNAGTTATVLSTQSAATVSATVVAAQKIATVKAVTGVTIDSGASLNALKSLNVSSSGAASILILNGGVALSAGLLASAAPSTGFLSRTDIASSGSLFLTAPTVSISGSPNILTSNGGDLKITATNSDLVIGSGHQFSANGGNILMFAMGNVGSSTATQDSFIARSVGDPLWPSASSGGGIEIGSGLTSSSRLSQALALRNVPSEGINPPAGALGVNVSFAGNSYGVIESNTVGTGAVNLNAGTGGASTLILNRGAQVFDAQPGTQVNFDHCQFTTTGLKPVALTSVPELQARKPGSEAVLTDSEIPGVTVVSVGESDVEFSVVSLNNAGSMIVPAGKADLQLRGGKAVARIYAGPATAFDHANGGAIYLKRGEIFLDAARTVEVSTDLFTVAATRGALVSVRSFQGGAYVRACGTAGSVSVRVGRRIIELSSGEELLVTNHKPQPYEIKPADGLARRNSRSAAAESHLYTTISDFAIVSMLSSSSSLSPVLHSLDPLNKRLIDRLLKAAASVDAVFGKRGPYQSR
jgi:mucin-19